jgi:hypothetical protein
VYGALRRAHKCTVCSTLTYTLCPYYTRAPQSVSSAQRQDDDKNIRRRVYDAFNVLLAVGIIAKQGKKDIVWKGFPTQQPTNLADLEVGTSGDISDAADAAGPRCGMRWGKSGRKLRGEVARMSPRKA